jgi:hypothetical protein
LLFVEPRSIHDVLLRRLRIALGLLLEHLDQGRTPQIQIADGLDPDEADFWTAVGGVGSGD